MDKDEREDFRLFCEQATDNQLVNIVEKEREASEGGDSYRETCCGIAEAVASARGVPTGAWTRELSQALGTDHQDCDCSQCLPWTY